MFFEKTLNPHFFAYGSFWSYIVLFLIKFLRFVPDYSFFPSDPFSRAIVLLRIFSATQGIGIIIISYFVGKILLKILKFEISNYKLLALPFLVATSPGLIQASHFGTFESSLTFLYFLFFYFFLKTYISNKHFLLNYLALVFVFSISLSIKITSLILLPIVFLLLFIKILGKILAFKKADKKINFIFQQIYIFIRVLFYLAILIFVGVLIFFISNPYSINMSGLLTNPLKNFQSFRDVFSSDFISSINYEAGVARGTLPVFYTQQFQNTIPVFYQFIKIFPYVLNPIIFFLFLAASANGVLQCIKFLILKSHSDKCPKFKFGYVFLAIFFLFIFIPNSILYVKWTRYIIPSLPYIYIFVFLFFLRFRRLSLITVILLIAVIFALFFTSVYSFDTRIQAAKWAKQNLKPDSRIISESYDMGIVPFNEIFNYSQIRLLNLYDLDDKINDTVEIQELTQLLAEANAVILPSRRIADTRFRLPQVYPNGSWFYKNLFSGKLGFRFAAQFSHAYDKIIPGLKPDESFTVFDHPEVLIFAK